MTPADLQPRFLVALALAAAMVPSTSRSEPEERPGPPACVEVRLAGAPGASPAAARKRARLEVLPVFFVPRDVSTPSESQIESFRKHLSLARERYRTLLKGRDTFALSARELIHRSRSSLAFFRSKGAEAGPHVLAELLARLQVDRHHCPYVLAIVFMNPTDGFPAGSGIPINAGYDTGGGYLLLSSQRLDHGPGFHSTLEHELGHAFGLPHVDEAHGYDMQGSESIMSYNPHHVWEGFAPPPRPGTLIPEDLEALALNKLVFPFFRFVPETDVPEGYRKASSVIALFPPVRLPLGPEYRVHVSTRCGSSDGTSVENVVPRFIGSPASFKKQDTWVSAAVEDREWVTVTVEFPEIQTVNALVVHSQQDGGVNRAEAVNVEYFDGTSFRTLCQNTISAPDVELEFPNLAVRTWRFSFKPGASRKVTIRGLEFFDGGIQLYPPLYPYRLWWKLD